MQVYFMNERWKQKNKIYLLNWCNGLKMFFFFFFFFIFALVFVFLHANNFSTQNMNLTPAKISQLTVPNSDVQIQKSCSLFKAT